MRKATIAFERVPLKHVRRILEEQNNADERSTAVPDGDNDSKRIARDQRPSPNNPRKHRARPKRSIRREGEDHPIGLWIDKEIFRRHQNRPPQIVLHDSMLSSNSRYLALADCVLTPKKSKPKRSGNETG